MIFFFFFFDNFFLDDFFFLFVFFFYDIFLMRDWTQQKTLSCLHTLERDQVIT